jgi:hypothetical protein
MNKKECINSYNWFQTLCTTKTCPFLWKYMFIIWRWWITKLHKNFKVFKFWRKGYREKHFKKKTIRRIFLFNGFKMFSSRCKSHVQEIFLQKNMFSCPLKLILEFLGFFAFLTINQNIHTQLCMNVKTHHRHMNYLKLNYSIFLT